MSDISRAAELAARKSYGRLLAYLAAKTHDVSLAEDALSDAFLKALSSWSKTGPPSNPEAWLLTTARNKLTDLFRRKTRWETDDDIPEIEFVQENTDALPDRRLALMMVCAHPAIAQDMHVPLILQTVLGLKAETIARLMLVSPAALSKRLTRAKSKIRDARISFKLPDKTELPERADAIAEAIYALYCHDWLAPSDSLGQEALYLADLLNSLLPESTEYAGLAALIAFGHSRVNARTQNGILVPTAKQNPAHWNASLIAYGRAKLYSATRVNQVGKYQLEAAIEEVHISRQFTGKTDWIALDHLYYGLKQFTSSAGLFVAHAVVQSEIHGAKFGLEQLENIEQTIGSAFQPLWASKAEMHSRLRQYSEASHCYTKAIALSTEMPVTRFLQKRLEAVQAYSALSFSATRTTSRV